MPLFLIFFKSKKPYLDQEILLQIEILFEKKLWFSGFTETTFLAH